MPRRWTVDHAVAVFEVVCAVVVVVWMGALGLEVVATPDRTVVDRAFPFLVGLVAGALLLRGAARSWRAGIRAADGPADDEYDDDADDEDPLGRSVGDEDAADREAGRAGAAPPTDGPPPPLSPDGERELARVVAVLAGAGVFAPRVPDPVDLRGPVADSGEPVTAYDVLSALHEAEYHVPGFDAAAYSANLAFHADQVEQLVDGLRGHVDDLVRLAGGALADVSATVDLAWRTDTPRVPTTVRLRIGDEERVLAYDGAAKYLSTVVHVALARLLRERGTGLRIASLWSDGGIWLTALPDGGVERLNAALGPAAGEGWEWVDGQEPNAAGEGYPPR